MFRIITTALTIAVICTVNLPAVEHFQGSTYLGGSSADGSYGYDVATDNLGFIFVASSSTSADFPTLPGSLLGGPRGGSDIVVAKFTPDLSDLVAVSIIGGSATENWVWLDIGDDGQVYLLSLTTSSDFPTTEGAYSDSRQGASDMTITILDNDLSEIMASTLFGGVAEESEPGIAVDHDGNVFVGGFVSSNAFPTTEGAYRQTYGGGTTDFFVSKLSPDLSTLLASTFIGGRYAEDHSRLEVDGDGYVVLAGRTESDDYPATPGAYSEDLSEPPAPGMYLQDGTISKFSNDLSTLEYSTYFGVPGYDGAHMITVDRVGNIVVGGHALSPTYPVSPGAFDYTHNGSNECFISKFDPTLSTLLASTFVTPDHLGFTAFIFGLTLSCDADGRTIMAGVVWGQAMYTTPDAYDRYFHPGSEPGWGDAMVFVFDPALSSVEYATFLGGVGDDPWAKAIRTRDEGLVLFGITASTDFPTTDNAFQDTHAGGSTDFFVTKFGFECCDQRVGDVNGSGDEPTISDIAMLIDMLFISSNRYLAACVTECDVNQSGGSDPSHEDITISDISMLIDYLFITGQSMGLPDCP